MEACLSSCRPFTGRRVKFCLTPIANRNTGTNSALGRPATDSHGCVTEQSANWRFAAIALTKCETNSIDANRGLPPA
jgi:hypothetical protein